VWGLAGSVTSYRGEDFGDPGPLAEQTRLGDFWFPQRGVFFVGRARFTPVAGGADPSGTPPSPARARMG
ncbi:hypothetical protein, partial [Nocardioides sp. P5_C9_2]